MPKVVLNTISSGYGSVDALNDNFDIIEEGFDNTLSRDGSSPNEMAASLDMSGNHIINLGAPSGVNDAARLIDISDSDATGVASAILRAELGSTSINLGASLIGINDVAADFTATTVEGALAELQSDTEVLAADIVTLTNTKISVSTIDAKGDLLVGTANDTAARIAVGADGTIPMARSAATTGLAYVSSLTKTIYGLTYSNAAVDLINDITIDTGGAMDASGAYWMLLVPSITKRSDAAWAVGTNAGGLDAGAIGNNDYYIWLIARSDTGVVDVLFSLSAIAPTMPTNYNFKRLIGWFKRTTGTIVPFVVYETGGGGIEFLWETTLLDINLADALTTAERLDTIRVPLDFSVKAHIVVRLLDTSSAFLARISCPDTADQVVAAIPGQANYSAAAGQSLVVPMHIRTNSGGAIAARADLATVDSYRVSTIGFEWARRN